MKNATRLQVRTFGAFDIVRDGETISTWPRRRTQQLFKVLLTAPGDAFTVDQLIDALMPDADPGRAAANVRARVSELRSVLEPNRPRGAPSTYVLRVGEGYAFNVKPGCWLDSARFQEQLAQGHRHADRSDWIEAADAFEGAMILYRGEFLAEDRYAEWAESARSHFRELYLDGLGRLSACYAQLDRHRQAISCCRKALAVDSCREDIVRQLIECQCASGQRAQAMESYRELERVLRKRLDVEPSPELRRRFQELSRQEDVPEKLDPRRLAVIPFVPVGGNREGETLADGVTEELIYTLSNVAGLEVIAQTTVLKYKGAGKSVAEIGEELHVGSVLEGSVQRVGDRARVLVQLIDVPQETHRWAQQYDHDLGDILAVQASIAQRTAEALRVRLLPKEKRILDADARLDSKAQSAYIRGRQLLGRRTADAYRKAIASFQQVLAVAPKHPRSLVGMAEASLGMADYGETAERLRQVKDFAEAALQVDPGCAEAHALRGRAHLLLGGDIEEAAAEFLRAIDLSPNCVLAHVWYAALLGRSDRRDEACRHSEMALSLDPLSGPLVLSHAANLHIAGRLAEAADQYRRAIEIDPEQDDAWWGLWYSLAGAWDWDRAERITRQGVAEHPENPFSYVNLATCLMCRGRLEEGLVEIHRAVELVGEPKRTQILFHAGGCHYFGRQYEEAIGYFREALARNPASNPSHIMIAKCCIQLGRCEEALAELDVAENAFGGSIPFWQTHIHMDRGKIYAFRGETEKAEAELAVLMENPGRPNYRIAVSGILRVLGRVDEAWDWLESAATAREPHMAALRKAPDFEAYHSDPRYVALLKRVGLDDGSSGCPPA